MKTKSDADRGLEYLGVRAGKKTWRARLYWTDPRTGKYRSSLVTFTAQSRQLARVERDRRLAVVIRGAVTGERMRFRAAGEAWFATVTSRGSRISWGSHLTALTARYGDWYLDAFTRPELQSYLDALPQSPGTVNSRRDVLKHVFRLGVRKGWCEHNPAAETERRSTRRTADAGTDLADAPQRALTVDEAATLLSHLRDHEWPFYPLVATQLVLGCRFAEVSALQWDDVDMNTGLVHIRRGVVRGTVGPTKGKYARTSAVGPSGLLLLRDHRLRMQDQQWPSWQTLVFPGPPHRSGKKERLSDHWSFGTVYAALKRSYAALGFDVRGATHIMRHTMVTQATAHASEALLRRVVGHRTADVHQRYQHPEDAQVIDLGARIESALMRERSGK